MLNSFIRRVLNWSPNKSPTRRRRQFQLTASAVVETLECRQLLSGMPVTPSVPLHVVGNQLQNPSGQTEVLRGVNIDGQEGWGKPGGGLVYDQDVKVAVESAVTAALSWGANLIRLPVNQDFWLGLDPGVKSAAYIADIDSLIKQVSNAGGYVMLVAKVTDGGTGNPMLESGDYSLPDNNTAAFWKSVAKHYANNSAVMFDLFNEPGHFIASYSQWKNGATKFSENVDGHQVTYASPGMEGLIQDIRSVAGAKNIIAAEGMGYADDFSAIGTAISQVNGLTDSAKELIYSVHIYPGVVSDASNVAALNNVLPSSVTSNYPIYVGEWGADVIPGAEGAPSTSAKAWNQNMLNWLATKPYSWTAWAMNAEPWLTIQGTTTPTTYFGQLVKTYLTNNNHLPSINASVQFQDTDDWGSGFVGYITITNHGTTPIIGWTLQFNFTGVISANPNPAKLTNIWNATWVSHTGNQYVIQNDSTDITIAPGQSIRFGFVATWANSHIAPAKFILNGTVIQ